MIVVPDDVVAAEMVPYVVMPQYCPSPVMNSMFVLEVGE